MIRIRIAATQGSHSERILPRLRNSAAEVIELPVDSIQQTDDPLLLLYGRPEEAARQAIAQDTSVSDALAEWATQARTMLDAFRRNRVTALVLEGATACRAIDSVAQILFERAGMEIADRTPVALPDIDPLQHVLAAQWVAEIGELSHLCGALEAASTPLTGAIASKAPRAEAAYRQYRSAVESEEERELLLVQLHQVQEELEQTVLDRQSLKDEHAQCAETLAAAKRTGVENTTEIQKLREQLAAAEKAPKPADDAEVAELKEENELLLLQLHQVQEELESYYLQLQEVKGTGGAAAAQEEELYALVRYASELEKRYLRVLKSRTWKLMAPVREAGRVIKSVVGGKRVPRNALPKRPAAVSRYFPPAGGSHAG